MSTHSWLSAHDSQPDLPRAPLGGPGGGSCRRLEEALGLAGAPAGANKLRKPVRSPALEACKQKREKWRGSPQAALKSRTAPRKP